MYDRSSSLVLRWLKVPPEPHAPHGDPASLRVFRAGKNLFNLRLFGWAVAQLVALAGIIFWFGVFISVEETIKARHQAGQVPVQPTSVKNLGEYIEKIGTEEKPAAPATSAAPAPAAPEATVAAASADAKKAGEPSRDQAKKKRARVRISGWAGFKQVFVELGLLLPAWSFPLLWGLKILGVLVYVIQIPITYTIRRLDYELRWYMVTDRSLRIRHGVWNVSESTMSFANIQQVVVSQGPLQRVLGLSDVKVQSAGGGSGGEDHRGQGEDMHMGLFHSVTNAPEIRDLILERLRRFRESGLGDPDEKSAPVAAAATATHASSGDTLAAARELLGEAKALRAVL